MHFLQDFQCMRFRKFTTIKSNSLRLCESYLIFVVFLHIEYEPNNAYLRLGYANQIRRFLQGTTSKAKNKFFSTNAKRGEASVIRN